MHPIKNIFFFIGSILYLWVFFARRLNLAIPTIVNSYLTDILMMPLVLMFTLWLTRKIKRLPNLIFSPLIIGVIFIYISLVFEYFLPKSYPIHTADWMDVIMYGIGGLIYYAIQRKYFLPKEKVPTKNK